MVLPTRAGIGRVLHHADDLIVSGRIRAPAKVVTDGIFESLMPLYCALPETTNNCVTDSVQWGILTYDVNGHPMISGCAASGCQSHSCTGFESGPPVILVQPSNQSVNSGQSATFGVDVSGVAPLYYQWVFDGTNLLAGDRKSVV